MTPTLTLLDAYKKKTGIGTDSAAADRLHLSRSAVSLWRLHKGHPDADAIEKMAHGIGEPVGPWLAQIEAERARTPANRQVWLRLAATLGTSLALAVIALPSHAQAFGRLDVQTSGVYCVKLHETLD